MAEVVNNGDYDVVFCEQDRYTMAPFFLKYIKKPHVYYCQQPNIFRSAISIRNYYKNAGLLKKNLPEYIRLKFYGSRMINFDKKTTQYSKYTIVNSNFSKDNLLQSYGVESFVSLFGN